MSRALILALVLAACGNDKGSGQIDADLTDSSGDGDAPNGSIDAAIDAPPGGPGVTCGSMTCTTGMDCCTTFGGGGGGSGGGPMYACVASGAACGGVSTSCDGPEDCTNGDRCCGTGGGGGGGGGIECVSGNANCYLERCHMASDCKTAGDKCCSSQFFGQYCAAMCF